MQIITFVFFCSCWLAINANAPFPQTIGGDAFAESVKQTLNALGGIAVKPRDPSIPVAVRLLLTKLKHEIRDLILSKMNDKRIPWNSPDELKSQVILSLKKAGVEVGKQAQDQNWKDEESHNYFYNQIDRISIEAPAGYSDLIIATTTIWVMCGEDTSFYVFRRKGAEWNLILDHEASNYEDIRGAQSQFGYAISPSDSKGDFFIVTADVNPWCSSFWQRLRYSVVRPGSSPTKPEILLKRSDTIYLGVAPPIFYITVEQDRFRLVFHGDWYWDPDSGASSQFAEYRVSRHGASLVKRGKIEKDHEPQK
ncbi:MAG: hypothetical protein LAP85_29495 [Acidobacteriia bacterium]|nr:hypothetical protein [Terriglobia bacterium]